MLLEHRLPPISWLDRFPETHFVGSKADLPITDMELIKLGVVEPEVGETTVSRSKVKFSCPECGANAWGKPTLNLICGLCDEALLPQG